MKASFMNISFFDFHDSYIELIDRKKGECYLQAVNVLPEFYDTDSAIWMRASLMKITFNNLIIKNTDIDLDSLADNKFEILEVKIINQCSDKKNLIICMEDRRDYLELELSFTDLILEWDEYEDKSWHSYLHEEDYVKKYIQSEDTDWVYIEQDKRKYYSKELDNELCEDHELFKIGATPLMKKEGSDDVLYSLCNGKIAVVHLTYCKENSCKYPKFIIYNSIEEAM